MGTTTSGGGSMTTYTHTVYGTYMGWSVLTTFVCIYTHGVK